MYIGIPNNFISARCYTHIEINTVIVKYDDIVLQAEMLSVINGQIKSTFQLQNKYFDVLDCY